MTDPGTDPGSLGTGGSVSHGTLLGDVDVRMWQRARPLADGVEEDKQVARPLLQDPIGLSPVLATKLDVIAAAGESAWRHGSALRSHIADVRARLTRLTSG